MNTITLDVDSGTFADITALARATGQDVNQFATALLVDTVKERQRRERGLAEGRRLLEEPATSLAEADARLRAKYGIPDLSHLTNEQLADEADRIIDSLDPGVRAELEREGSL